MPKVARKAKVLQSTAKYSKKKVKRGSYVPYAQQARIVAKSAAGKSIRQIAKEENRNQDTVSKIVKSEDMQAEATRLREELFGEVGGAVVVRLKHTISDPTSKHGDWIAVEIGEQLGILPGKIRKLQVNGNNNGQVAPPQSTEKQRVEKIVTALVHTVMDRGEYFGDDDLLPDVDEVTHEIEIPLRKEKD